MSFVQEQSLPNLLCAYCNKYLSHFPINFHPDRGMICGRCAIPAGVNVIRNEAYENLARFQKFPCCYKLNGCLESLLPENIPQHERLCTFKKHVCPTSKRLENCAWKGFVKDLLEHFEQKHPTLILKNGQFEIDFINSHKEKYLLPFGEDTFIVDTSTDSRTGTFCCNVSYVGSNPKAENYSYKIILKGTVKSKVHEITNALNTLSSIKASSIRSILDDPISIIASIEILDIQDSPEITLQEEENYNSAINYDVLRELECLVCLEYMVPPIHQCMTGHSICLRCKNQVTECPACKQEFKNTQNFALGQIINCLIYPCKYEKCQFAAKAKETKHHELTCVYGPFECPLKEYVGCNSEVAFIDIYNHIENNHYENLLEIDTVCIPFEYDNLEEDEDCYILRYASRMFKLHYLYREDTFYWAMQLIGPEEEAVKYLFEIDILDNSGNNCRTYFRLPCSPLSDKDHAFDDDTTHLYLDFDLIKHLITDKLNFRVHVLQK